MEAVSYPNLAPSLCVVCESVPPETPFVDTLNNFAPAGFTHLNGRKYICANCVRDAANALDLFEEAVAPAKAQVEDLEVKVAQLEADVASYESIQNAVAQLTAPRPEVESKVEAATKTAKAKATARTKAATAAQKELNDAAEAAAEGAERQKVLNQEAADRQQASVEAAANPAAVVEPDLTVTPPAGPVNPPVVPVGQNGDAEKAPNDGDIWDGEKWVTPPAEDAE